MPRTPDDIAVTDKTARECSYSAPPSDIDVKDWTGMARWFDDHGVSWHDGVLIFISRRYDVPISEAYLATDSWAKGELRRRDLRDDPDAVVSYN